MLEATNVTVETKNKISCEKFSTIWSGQYIIWVTKQFFVSPSPYHQWTKKGMERFIPQKCHQFFSFIILASWTESVFRHQHVLRVILCPSCDQDQWWGHSNAQNEEPAWISLKAYRLLLIDSPCANLTLGQSVYWTKRTDGSYSWPKPSVSSIAKLSFSRSWS